MCEGARLWAPKAMYEDVIVCPVRGSGVTGVHGQVLGEYLH